MSKELRRKLRANSTGPERAFWRLIHPLRTNGWHFRKQVEIGSYYVDFACMHAGVVIEIDGDTHFSELAERNDETRDDYLTGRGFKILRFTNDEVLTNPDGVYAVLADLLETRSGNRRAKPPPPPSPQGGGCSPGGSEPIQLQTRSGTLPLAGRAGEGDQPAPNSRRDRP